MKKILTIIILFFIVGCKKYIHTYEVYQGGKHIDTITLINYQSKQSTFWEMGGLYYKDISVKEVE
jgi:hypothetical protein